MSRLIWTFTDAVAADRRRSLTNAPSFAGMVTALRGEMRVLCGHEDTCKDDRAFSRAAFSVEISQRLFDLLFNSVNGYRASFFRSPYDGLRNNARLIRVIAPVLIETTDGKVDGSFARQSLDSLTAKVWLAENGNKVCRECPGCEGEWSSPQDDEPELRNGRWELSTDKRGRKAPYLTKLRVFGGFLNGNRDEWVAARKRRRSHDIHDFGWS